MIAATVELERRDAWQALLEGLPADVPLAGVVHLAALDGHGPQATTAQMAEDTRRVSASALALVQGVLDADVTPANGVSGSSPAARRCWRRSAPGELSGATLWGLGKVMAHAKPFTCSRA